MIGENFPYSNFHDMNMDWLIKIAKDFLDQYTSIQETITQGESDLETTAENLEAALQQWYDTHSLDMQQELAEAVAAFATQAQQIGQAVIDSIPEDYTTLTNEVTSLKNSILNINNGYITTGGVFTPASGYYCTALIPLYMVKSVHCMPDDTTLHIHIFDDSGAQKRQYSITTDSYFPLIATDSDEMYVRIWGSGSTIVEFTNRIEIDWTVTKDLYFPPVWTNGYIANNGTWALSLEYTNSTLIPINLIKEFTVKATKTVNANYYDKSKTALSTGTFTAGTYDYIDRPNAAEYVRFWFAGNDLSAIEDTINIVYGANESNTVVVFGDSWADDDPDHTEYRKWTTHLKECKRYNVLVYAQNGALITGDNPDAGLNGNVLGQVNAFLADHIAHVDTFIINGGLNDFRDGVASGYVCLAIKGFIDTLKPLYPKARIIYIANHQIYITHEELDYFNFVVNYARRIDRTQAFTTFGWVNANNYIDDLAHPNNDGHKSVFANILAILEGGDFYYVTNKYTVSQTGLDFQIQETWVDGKPFYSANCVCYAAIMGQTVTLTVPTSEKALCGSFPFTKHMHKVQPSTITQTDCVLDSICNETFSTTHKINDTNTFQLMIPATGTGAYKTGNRY